MQERLQDYPAHSRLPKGRNTSHTDGERIKRKYYVLYNSKAVTTIHPNDARRIFVAELHGEYIAHAEHIKHEDLRMRK